MDALAAVAEEQSAHTGDQAGAQAPEQAPAPQQQQQQQQQPRPTRKRGGAPPDPCPWCGHTYTVRDGLSPKLDAQGNKLHLRRCQCREKAPPCKNCPSCKASPELMLATSIEAQLDLCRRTVQCAICACSCPGVGKWVEQDEASRAAFAARTGRRHQQLTELGWSGPAAAAPPSPSGTEGGGQGDSSVALPPGLKRLPQDIRAQLAAGGSRGGPPPARARQPAGGAGAATSAPPAKRPRPETSGGAAHAHAHAPGAGRAHTCDHPHTDCNSDCCSAPQVGLPAGGALSLPLWAGGALCGGGGGGSQWEGASLRSGGGGGTLAASGPPIAVHRPEDLPEEVGRLVDEVFAAAAGPEAASAVRSFLHEQCVGSLADLSFMRLEWLCDRLEPRGLPGLLLNKLLALGAERAVAAAAAAAAAAAM